MTPDHDPIRRGEDGRIRHIDVQALMRRPDGFALLRAALEELEQGLPARDTYDVPPSLICPDTHRNSLTWQVKRGTAVLRTFVDWYKSLGPDLRRRFRERYPEPRGWAGFYDSLA
ncbi:hypothetical protein [Sagittula sp. S175]|uniref:hypothetical protein n=1 Tax=Sagittula sp. S175 TaxID=3415129 RepID=UPI003C7E6C58